MADIELRVWWIPQIPMEPFAFNVPSLQTGIVLLEALAQYDQFQLEHNTKPDYCSIGGMSWRHPELTEGEWYDFDPNDEYDLAEVTEALVRCSYVTTPKLVSASMAECPTRTLWRLEDDGYYQCLCYDRCPERLRYEELIIPFEVEK